MVGDRYESTVPHHHVVDHRNADGRAGSHELSGHRPILAGRGRVPRRVVVNENDACGTAYDGGPKHLARVDQGSVQNTPSDKDLCDDAMLRRQEERVELLLLQVSQARLHSVEDIAGASNAVAGVPLLGVRPTPQLQGRRDPSGSGLPYPRDGRDSQGGQRPQRPDRSVDPGKHPLGDLQSGGLSASAPDQNGQQLPTRERCRTEGDEALSRSLGGRYAVDRVLP